MLKIHAITIGDEILQGRIHDLNAPWLGNWLKQHHLLLKKIQVVGDRHSDLLLAMQESWLQADVIITSGGLGPTQDDITKEVMGAFFKRPMLFHASAAQMAQEHYQRLKKNVNIQQHTYAFLPQDFFPLTNPMGLAPGFGYFCPQNKKLLLCAPGVPLEYQEMFSATLLSLLEQYFPQRPGNFLRKMNIQTKYTPEEDLFQVLDPQLWDKLSAVGRVSSLPKTLGVDIGVEIWGEQLSQLEQSEAQVREIIRQSPIAPVVWNIGDQQLCPWIVEQASSLNVSFAFAESCTGGLVSSLITDVPGSSQCFKGAMICYDPAWKQHYLGVSPQTIAQFGIVSEEVALEMARGLLRQTPADYALSLTGLAGPGGGSEQVPVGTVAIGLVGPKMPGGGKSFTFRSRGDRKKLKLWFAYRALYLLQEQLLEHSSWRPLEFSDEFVRRSPPV